MLQKQKASARLQNAKDLRQRLIHLVDAAQRKSADDAIKHRVREWQALTIQDAPIDFDVRPRRSPFRARRHTGVTIDRNDFANVRRITRQIQARAGADFKDIAIDGREQFATIFTDEWLI